MRTTQAVLLALLLSAIVCSAKPAQKCANCGLGHGTNACGPTNFIVKAARVEKPTYTVPLDFLPRLNKAREQQRREEAIAGQGIPFLTGPNGKGLKTFTGPDGLTYGPGGVIIGPGLSGSDGPGSRIISGCGTGSSHVSPAIAAHTAATAAAAAAAQAAANAVAHAARQEKKELQQLLNLRPNTPIAPRFSPIGDLCDNNPYGSIPIFSPVDRIFGGGPNGPLGSKPPISAGSPSAIVAGVTPAKPGKVPCGCGASGPGYEGPSAFDVAVAEAAAKVVAQQQAVQQAAIAAANSPTGLVTKLLGTCNANSGSEGCSSGPGGPGGSGGPGSFKPLSSDFKPANEFEDKDEDEGMPFEEQEKIYNGPASGNPQIPADPVSIAVAYKNLQAMQTPTGVAPKRPVKEEDLFFGQKSTPTDGRVPNNVINVPEEKLQVLDKPVFEMQLPKVGQGPGAGPNGSGPRGPDDDDEDGDGTGTGPHGPGQKPGNYLTYGDLGFAPVSPGSGCSNFVNKDLKAKSTPASFSGPNTIIITGPSGNGGGPGGYGEPENGSSEIPCGPIGPPAPGYVPGHVIIEKPVGSGPDGDETDYEPDSVEEVIDLSCSCEAKTPSIIDRARAATRARGCH